MTDRERLIELIDEFGDDIAFCDICKRPDSDCDGCRNERFADYLLEHGVIVLPCKVGDTVYQVDAERIYESRVKQIIYDTDNIAFDERAIGKTVLLTREEAERKLKGRESNA